MAYHHACTIHGFCCSTYTKTRCILLNMICKPYHLHVWQKYLVIFFCILDNIRSQTMQMWLCQTNKKLQKKIRSNMFSTRLFHNNDHSASHNCRITLTKSPKCHACQCRCANDSLSFVPFAIYIFIIFISSVLLRPFDGKLDGGKGCIAVRTLGNDTN